jgi:hypothetical protein
MQTIQSLYHTRASNPQPEPVSTTVRTLTARVLREVFVLTLMRELPQLGRRHPAPQSPAGGIRVKSLNLNQHSLIINPSKHGDQVRKKLAAYGVRSCGTSGPDTLGWSKRIIFTSALFSQVPAPHRPGRLPGPRVHLRI